MQAMLEQLFQGLGLASTAPRYVCNHFSTVCNLVESTDAVSPVVSLGASAKTLAERFLVLDRVLRLERLALAVAWPERRQLSAAGGAFVDALLEDAAHWQPPTELTQG